MGIFRDFEFAERVIHAGERGVPDVLLLLPNGQYLFFDAKTGNAAFNKNQIFFKTAVYNSCGVTRVFKLRNIDDACLIIDEFLK